MYCKNKVFLTLVIVLFALVTNAQNVTLTGDFESGNIKSASQISKNNFSVTVRSDVVGRWFYFKINNVKSKFVKVSLANSDVNRAVYSYDNENWERFTKSESTKNGFQKTFEQQHVYVAYCFPYTFTKVTNHIKSIANSPFVKIDTLGFSELNNPIIQLRISNFDIPLLQKKRVWVHARTHPSETPSSYHVQGMIDYLLSNADQSNKILNENEYVIIPCINPDGVIGGYSRTNAKKADIERDYNKEEDFSENETVILRENWRKLNEEKQFSVYLNLHSEVAQKALLFIHTAGSTNKELHLHKKTFSLLQALGSSYLSIKDLEERPLKKIFLEYWLYKKYENNAMAITFETPYNFFSNGLEVTPNSLAKMGMETVNAISDYFSLIDNDLFPLYDNSNLVHQLKTTKQNNNSFFVNNKEKIIESNNQVEFKDRVNSFIIW